MKKLLVLILLVFVCGFSYGQKIQKVRSSSGGMNHGERVSVNSAIKGVNDYITYRYPSVIDMAAQPLVGNLYTYKLRTSSTSLLPYATKQGVLNLVHDTIMLNDFTRIFYINHSIYTFHGNTASTVTGTSRYYRYNNFTNSSTYETVGESLLVMLQPGAGERSEAHTMVADFVSIQSYTPSATGTVKLTEGINTRLYSSWDNYVTVDNVVSLDMYMRDVGINPDSIKNVYGIRNTSTDPLYGSEGTYVLWSDYGDIYSAGNLETLGFETVYGSDHASWGTKTDATSKSGIVATPHYNTTEDDVASIVGFNTETSNLMYIGGGLGTHNAITTLRINVAGNTTTSSGSVVAEFDSTGMELIGAIKQTQLTGALTDGAPTAAEINTITSLTPSTAGAGYAVTIADSDGSGLLYRIESDGTSWQYLVMTKAL